MPKKDYLVERDFKKIPESHYTQPEARDALRALMAEPHEHEAKASRIAERKRAQKRAIMARKKAINGAMSKLSAFFSGIGRRARDARLSLLRLRAGRDLTE